MSAISHFAMTTFCWLPPDRFFTRWVTRGVLIASVSTSSTAFRRVAAVFTQPNRLVNRPRDARTAFTSTSMPSASPYRLRSSER